MRKQGIDYQRLAVNLVDKNKELTAICIALDKDMEDVADGKEKHGAINLRDITWLGGMSLTKVAELLGDIKKK